MNNQASGFDTELTKVLEKFKTEIFIERKAIVTIEHLFLYLMDTEQINGFIEYCLVDKDVLRSLLKQYVSLIPKLNQTITAPITAKSFENVFFNPVMMINTNKKSIECVDLLESIFSIEESEIYIILTKIGITIDKFNEYYKMSSTEIQNKYLKNMNEMVDKKLIEPIIGRESEIYSITQTLNRKKKSNCLLIGEPGVGKCLAKGTKVLMLDGSFKKVEDIVVDDLLMGYDSYPRKVLKLGHGFDEMYKIKQEKGISYSVNSEHILSLLKIGDKSCEESFIHEITVKEYLSMDRDCQKTFRGFKGYVDFPEKDCSINHYWAGLYFMLDASIQKSIDWYAEQMFLDIDVSNERKSDIITKLNSYKKTGERRIADIFKINSEKNRHQFLAGLLDGKGDVGSNCYYLIEKDEQMIEDLIYLGRSLGHYVKTKKCETGTCVEFYGHLNHIPCKKQRFTLFEELYEDYLITEFEVEPIGRGEYFGFNIDGDGLFMLEDFTVTHNTAIVEGFAHKVCNDKKFHFNGYTVYSLDMGDVISNASMKGEFEGRMKDILNQITENEKVILFIDEIHALCGGGKSETMEGADILKPYLTNGQLKIIGATTYDDFRKNIQKNKAFMRRFQKIDVTEPNLKLTTSILNGIMPSYEEHYGLKFTKGSVESIVDLANRFLTNSFFPDKAIDLLDEIGSAFNLKGKKNVTLQDVYKVFSEKYNIKVDKYSDDTKYFDISSQLKKVIFGQDEVIDKMSDLLVLSKFGFKNEDKSINLLLAGASGVGKTELARQIAKTLDYNFVKIDMSEYQTKEDVSKLIGAPPGYIGFDQGGLLVEQLTKHPTSVILFDEIEKAHVDIYNIMLQIMDDGCLTDNTGKKANFKNAIVLMTSNLGVVQANKNKLGFDKSNAEEIHDAYAKSVEKHFAPEFLNRLDSCLYFNNLDKKVLTLIIDKFIKQLNNRLTQKKINVTLDKKAKDFIIENTFNNNLGARTLEHYIDQNISTTIVQHMIEKRLTENIKVKVTANKSELVVTFQ